MLKLPASQNAATFLKRHWQKQALFMPGALRRVRPAITRNELGWLATLEDVESRLIFVTVDENHTRYRAETGPFEPEYLQGLPKRDWTLLVHDVEKHLPAMRALFQHVPFIPDWRIDDLMVSFAAPGGGVGPHSDNYDVFLLQGIGVRDWRYTVGAVTADPGASDELALLAEFAGTENRLTSEGDVLYLPPGTPHWGTARRACMTYSIGMRAPQASDFCAVLNRPAPVGDAFYKDPDLIISEARPGYISNEAAQRACRMLELPEHRHDTIATALGKFATRSKDWLKPDAASDDESDAMLDMLRQGRRLYVHGMSQIAFDDRTLYVNGSSKAITPDTTHLLEKICTERALAGADVDATDVIRWMLLCGAFEIPEEPGPYVK